MTLIIKRLTNSAYGFPKGAPRRVTPVALACIHITGNKRVAAMDDPHAGALAEFNYANRAGSSGPSAHVYLGRDGWGVEAIDPTRYAAWSNGDVNDPNTANPGIRKVLALRSRGYNANEAYWLEIENVGYPIDYRITEAQITAMADIIRERAQKSGLPINRETVHGHWEINGVDRRLCPDINHEAFLNKIIDRANAEETMPLPVGDYGPFEVRLTSGDQIYDENLKPLKTSGDGTSYGFYVTGTGYVAIPVADSSMPTGKRLGFVKAADVNYSRPVPPPPPPAPDCTDAIDAAVAADRAKARITWG